jgi:glycerol-3-phosphate dehydrogenase
VSGAAPLPTADRAPTLDALEAERFDCVVVGGGITGAGIAREAALRGLSVALVEAEDFAAGTSSRSSKLIHGGLRYLALGDIGLVRETALERKAIFRLAPHLAEPRWMLVPARSRAGLLKLRAALATYEKLGSVADADRHRFWSGAELEREEPALRRDRYPHACIYREYLSDDARLVLANLRAAAGLGARLASRARADRILREGGRASGVEALCQPEQRRLRIRARAVVNAAGPWVEAVRRLEDAQAPALLHLSKGVHVVIPRARLPLRHVAILGTPDRRSIFAIPRGEIVYVGTTDTSDAGGARWWPEVRRADVEYLLAPLPRYFDVAPLEVGDCVASWAGLRPLVAQPGKPPAEISRRDEVWVGTAGVVTIAGGKLTGYRKMADQVVDKVDEMLDRNDPVPARGEEGPLPGGDFDGDLGRLAAQLARRTGLGAETASRLVRLYGTESEDVVGRGSEPLVPGARVLAGEVSWAVEMEAAASVEDVIYRRTRAALYEPGVRRDLVEPVAVRMGARLGWSRARIAAEIAGTCALLASELRFIEEEP